MIQKYCKAGLRVSSSTRPRLQGTVKSPYYTRDHKTYCMVLWDGQTKAVHVDLNLLRVEREEMRRATLQEVKG